MHWERAEAELRAMLHPDASAASNEVLACYRFHLASSSGGMSSSSLSSSSSPTACKHACVPHQHILAKECQPELHRRSQPVVPGGAL
jgi:hypothetical protein